ncbi:MAG: hypothetical protein Q8J74_00785 [Candidatus Didemnitutus sp.]|nr:hypothetical protein [Candidatus Didemnitutus sp.]
MADYDNTPPVAKALTGMSLDNTAPVAKAVSFTPDENAPTAKVLAGMTPDNTAPAAKVLAGITPDNTPPTAKALAGMTPENTEPEENSVGNFTPTDAAAVPITDAPISNITMPASFQPAFTEITGGGNCLDSLMATAADIGKILQGTVAGELKSYQVRAHAGAADLPGIVLPANHDPVTNAVAFFQAGL